MGLRGVDEGGSCLGLAGWLVGEIGSAGAGRRSKSRPNTMTAIRWQWPRVLRKRESFSQLVARQKRINRDNWRQFEVRAEKGWTTSTGKGGKGSG